MQNWKLLATVLFMLLFCTACSSNPTDSITVPKENNEVQKSVDIELDPYTKLAEEKSAELELVPLSMTNFGDSIGATLSHPVHQRFAANDEVRISGKIEKHEELQGHYAWIKMKTIDGSEENETFEYFTPIQNGIFNQTLHFFNGEGNYSVSIFLPSIDQKNYYSELTTFEVFNVNPAIRRDITYTPSGFDAGLIIDSPTTGFLEENEQITISGKVNQVHDKQTIMIQLKKDTDEWQHIIPVSKGHFSYDIPLFFGKGIYEVQVLVPDIKIENSYQFGSSFLIENSSNRRMDPIEFYRGYEERGIQLESPLFGGEISDLEYQISGKIDPLAPSANETTHLYIKTKKGQDEALDIIPIRNFEFDDKVYLRFGPGEYEVTIHVPEIKQSNTSFFSFYGVASFKVINSNKEDKRDLLPSRGIQSEAPEIIALANEITKDKPTVYEKTKAIYEYTAKNISYDVAKFKNSDFKWDDSATKTLQTETGVCQDYAYLATALLRAINIEARFISGQAGTSSVKENHAWVEANVDGRWLVMDPTWGSGFINGDQFVAQYTDKYFDPNETEFSNTHIREKPEY